MGIEKMAEEVGKGFAWIVFLIFFAFVVTVLIGISSLFVSKEILGIIEVLVFFLSFLFLFLIFILCFIPAREITKGKRKEIDNFAKKKMETANKRKAEEKHPLYKEFDVKILKMSLMSSFFREEHCKGVKIRKVLIRFATRRCPPCEVLINASPWSEYDICLCCFSEKQII